MTTLSPESTSSPSEVLTHDSFNAMLHEARALHYGAEKGQMRGDLKVVRHTDQGSELSIGDIYNGGIDLIIEETPAGLLLKTAERRFLNEVDAEVRFEAVLLDSVATAKVFKKTYPTSRHWSNHRYDASAVIRKVREEGVSFTEDSASQWIEGLHHLNTFPETKPGDSPKHHNLSRRLGKLLGKQAKAI